MPFFSPFGGDANPSGGSGGIGSDTFRALTRGMFQAPNKNTSRALILPSLMHDD
jgi:hypothetical protein